jgi:GTPase SAR1 family protein
MSKERLDQQVDAYAGWKRELTRNIMRYRSWLALNRLNSQNLDARLERALQLLRSDHISLAFVGEFSRGKTELINSLLFSGYGQRMLPSSAGRTTMCPTELFHDPDAGHAYLRLLPIETRSANASLAQFKQVARHWLEIRLERNDQQSMALALAQIARSKPVPLEKAVQLGFQPEMLEPADKPGLVMVPAWRHALINIDHPLLRQGLRILDTPGLNALGSEPELTLSMLPSAQVIMFLLSADSGVTASDMAIWQQHLQPLRENDQLSLFALLNKIDVLWDDPAGEDFVQQAILRMQETTARQLGLSAAEVLPLAAKQGLLARLQDDPQRLARSQLEQFEALLSERVVAQKERMLEERVVNEVAGMLGSSQQILGQRLQQVREQQTALASHGQDNGQMLLELTASTKEQHGLYHRRLLGLKSNQGLILRQGELLCQATRPERLDAHIEVLSKTLAQSLTPIGVGRAMRLFFGNLADDLATLANAAEGANRMVESIYERHNSESPLAGMDAPRFELGGYQRELDNLQQQAESFRLQLKNILSDPSVVSQRFFATLGREVIALHQRIVSDAGQWANDALLPLIQHTLEHKQLLESHMLRLRAMAQETHEAQRRSLQLQNYIDVLARQLTEADDILRSLRRPAPLRRQAKVVKLPGAGRQQGGE